MLSGDSSSSYRLLTVRFREVMVEVGKNGPNRVGWSIDIIVRSAKRGTLLYGVSCMDLGVKMLRLLNMYHIHT